jgi:hypothetical protein
MPWNKKVIVGMSHVFQQDGKPAHNSHLVQNRFRDNMEIIWPKEFWPSNSPDLKPPDYYISGAVKSDNNKSRHTNIALLQ